MVRSRRTKVAPEEKLRICCAPTAVGCCCSRFAQHPDQHPLRRHRCNRTALGRSRSAGSIVRLGNPRSTAFATQRIPDGGLLRRRRRRLIRAERRTVVRGCIEDAHDYANRFWDSQRNRDFSKPTTSGCRLFAGNRAIAQSWHRVGMNSIAWLVGDATGSVTWPMSIFRCWTSRGRYRSKTPRPT